VGFSGPVSLDLVTFSASDYGLILVFLVILSLLVRS
jgi:hypothetical protein